jgi:hypothetical protein
MPELRSQAGPQSNMSLSAGSDSLVRSGTAPGAGAREASLTIAAKRRLSCLRRPTLWIRRFRSTYTPRFVP